MAPLTGAAGQIEWAERLKTLAAEEFDRIGNAFSKVAERQQGQDRLDTLAIIAILEKKRKEVLGNADAGYFIRRWQELGGQVQMLAQDSRYQEIQVQRRLRKASVNHVV